MLNTKLVNGITVVPILDMDTYCFSDVSHASKYITEHLLGVGGSVIAINPEKIVKAYYSPPIKSILSDASLLYLDGIGAVKLAERKSGLKLKRVPGCELWLNLIEKLSSTNKSIFIVGSSSEVNNKTCYSLHDLYGAKIVGNCHGFNFNAEKVCEEIFRTQPDFVSVALGSPMQEKFISFCHSRGVKSLMMGVGGTYDVYFGESKRAPLFFRNLHLEWFYRFLLQPTRLLRQLHLLKFIYLFRKL